MRISDRLKQFLESLLTPGQAKFENIIIKEEALLSIIDFARAAYPKEFVAVLEGRTEKGSLTITGVLYQPFQSSKNAAIMKQDLPLTSGAVGTIHSHPSPNNRPSGQDLQLFGRGGIVHMIIGYPFSQATLACYDLSGNPLEFRLEP